jgi:predicted nucleic acid-binding protein
VGSLIDSSVIVAADRGHLDWQKVVADLSSEPTAISAITAAELLQGVERADPKHRPRREKFVEEVLAATPVLAFDVVAARVHARMAANLLSKGEVIGAHDLLIAATAVRIGYRVVTRDVRSFPRIPGLDVVVL